MSGLAATGFGTSAEFHDFVKDFYLRYDPVRATDEVYPLYRRYVLGLGQRGGAATTTVHQGDVSPFVQQVVTPVHPAPTRRTGSRVIHAAENTMALGPAASTSQTQAGVGGEALQWVLLDELFALYPHAVRNYVATCLLRAAPDQLGSGAPWSIARRCNYRFSAVAALLSEELQLDPLVALPWDPAARREVLCREHWHAYFGGDPGISPLWEPGDAARLNENDAQAENQIRARVKRARGMLLDDVLAVRRFASDCDEDATPRQRERAKLWWGIFERDVVQLSTVDARLEAVGFSADAALAVLQHELSERCERRCLEEQLRAAAGQGDGMDAVQAARRALLTRDGDLSEALYLPPGQPTIAADEESGPASPSPGRSKTMQPVTSPDWELLFSTPVDNSNAKWNNDGGATRSLPPSTPGDVVCSPQRQRTPATSTFSPPFATPASVRRRRQKRGVLSPGAGFTSTVAGVVTPALPGHGPTHLSSNHLSSCPRPPPQHHGDVACDVAGADALFSSDEDEQPFARSPAAAAGAPWTPQPTTKKGGSQHLVAQSPHRRGASTADKPNHSTEEKRPSLTTTPDRQHWTPPTPTALVPSPPPVAVRPAAAAATAQSTKLPRSTWTTPSSAARTPPSSRHGAEQSSSTVEFTAMWSPSMHHQVHDPAAGSMSAESVSYHTVLPSAHEQHPQQQPDASATVGSISYHTVAPATQSVHQPYGVSADPPPPAQASPARPPADPYHHEEKVPSKPHTLHYRGGDVDERAAGAYPADSNASPLVPKTQRPVPPADQRVQTQPQLLAGPERIAAELQELQEQLEEESKVLEQSQAEFKAEQAALARQQESHTAEVQRFQATRKTVTDYETERSRVDAEAKQLRILDAELRVREEELDLIEQEVTAMHERLQRKDRDLSALESELTARRQRMQADVDKERVGAEESLKRRQRALDDARDAFEAERTAWHSEREAERLRREELADADRIADSERQRKQLEFQNREDAISKKEAEAASKVAEATRLQERAAAALEDVRAQAADVQATAARLEADAKAVDAQAVRLRDRELALWKMASADARRAMLPPTPTGDGTPRHHHQAGGGHSSAGGNTLGLEQMEIALEGMRARLGQLAAPPSASQGVVHS